LARDPQVHQGSPNRLGSSVSRLGDRCFLFDTSGLDWIREGA
jgi:hypothetical protein